MDWLKSAYEGAIGLIEGNAEITFWVVVALAVVAVL